MTTSSTAERPSLRSQRLNQITNEPHTKLDALVKAHAPFETQANFARFVVAQYLFQSELVALYNDAELNQLNLDASNSLDQSYRKTLYKSCLDIIVDWAVEVPVYQRQNAIIFSTQRVNMNTVTPDITTFYGWLNEVEKIELN